MEPSTTTLLARSVELVREGPKNDDGTAERMLPHEGKVEVVMMDQANECVVTGGEDGYLRWSAG